MTDINKIYTTKPIPNVPLKTNDYKLQWDDYLFFIGIPLIFIIALVISIT